MSELRVVPDYVEPADEDKASYVMVVPSVVPELSDMCVRSFFEPENVLLVDNTVVNRGVAASWNLGWDRVCELDREWLVVCSQSVVFGERRGEDFIRSLDVARSFRVVEAGGGLGWHLIAFHRDVFDKIGYFDEIFYPAYYEDNDYSYRFQIAYQMGAFSRSGLTDGPLWPKADVDCVLRGTAEGIKRTDIVVDFVDLERKYEAKWGGVGPNEKYDRPYNSSILNYRFARRVSCGD